MGLRYVSVVICLMSTLSGNNCVLEDKRQDGICNQNATDESKCCVNYFYNAASNQCEECIGGYGVNCNISCPAGFFGRQCLENCSCRADKCDKIVGCRNNTAEITNDNEPSSSGILRKALYVTLATLAVLVGVLLIVLYRVKKTSGGVFPGEVVRNNETTINNVLTGSQSSVTYAEVANTNRGPIRAIEQNDVMYGNLLKINQQENGKKQEINDLYPYRGDLEGEYSATRNTYSVCCPLDTTESVVYSEVRKEKKTTKGSESRSEDR